MEVKKQGDMMKVYTRIRIDIATGKTIEEDSYEYSGPVALCWGDPGDASEYGGAFESGAFQASEWDKEFGPGAGDSGLSANMLGSFLPTDRKAWGSFVDLQGNPIDPSALETSMSNSSFDMSGFNLDGGGGTAIQTPTGPVSLKDLWASAKPGLAVGLALAGVPGAIIGAIVGMASKGLSSGAIAKSLKGVEGLYGIEKSIQHPTALMGLIDQYKESNPGTVLKESGVPAEAVAAIQEQQTNTGGATGGNMNDQLSQLLSTAQSPDLEKFNTAMNEFAKINTDIKFIHDISELEGGLSDEEKGFLETIRSNATTNLTEAVNESTIELAQSEIAKLVDRGVLQGDIGAQTISKIYEKSGKIVGEQSRNIESDVAKMGLQISEQKKTNQMALWGKELEADIASANVGVDKWKSIGALELGAEEKKMGWDQNLINALTTMRGQDISFESAKLGASTNLNLASQEMGAWKTAQDRQMWGNIGSVLIDKWL